MREILSDDCITSFRTKASSVANALRAKHNSPLFGENMQLREWAMMHAQYMSSSGIYTNTNGIYGNSSTSTSIFQMTSANYAPSASTCAGINNKDFQNTYY